MSTSERFEFLAADGLDDWVVLHGGPTAVYTTAGVSDAAKLALAISEIPGFDSKHSQLNIVSNQLTVRLTREVWTVTKHHTVVAKAISELANSFGAVAEPSKVQEVQIAIAAKADSIDLGFWQAVLGYEPMLDDNAVDPLGNSSTVWMQEISSEKQLRHAMHLDVSVSKEQAQSRLRAALDAGGVLIDDSHAPAWWILADRSGNKVCIVAWPDGAPEPK